MHRVPFGGMDETLVTEGGSGGFNQPGLEGCDMKSGVASYPFHRVPKFHG